MKVTCPNCKTSYAVDVLTFPPEGRSVRCAKCKMVWHAIAYNPEPDVLPPDSGEIAAQPPARSEPGVSDEGGAEAGSHQAVESLGAQIVDDGSLDAFGEGGPSGPEAESIEQAAETRARMAARQAGKRPKIRYKNSGQRGLEAFALGCVLAIFIAALHYRDDVVRSLPGMAGLYEMVGLPVNLRGLEFENVTQRRDFENGVPVLIIEGDIVNIRDRATPVPALRFSLRGETGDELYAWTLEPRQRAVDPSMAMSFKTRLASPPRGAEDVQVRFTERDRRIVEYAK